MTQKSSLQMSPRVVGFDRDPSHAEALSADAGTGVTLDKWHLLGPRPATEVASEVLGIHVKGTGAWSMRDALWYVPR